MMVAGILLPMMLRNREQARLNTCRNNLRSLTLALHHYHNSFGVLPVAAYWDANATASLSLHRSKQIDKITRENWLLAVLPFTSYSRLVEGYDASRPIGDPSNIGIRTARLPHMVCPADDFNHEDNKYRFSLGQLDTKVAEFARGNYAINGGSHNAQFEPPDTTSSKGDTLHLVIQQEPRTFEMWGNGIAGINRSFSLKSFLNGQSTLVALEELRAGIHPLDPRGVWALGQIGGSITWAHGVNGDAFGPNNLWPRADDILGCAALHETVGSIALAQHKMPCVAYIDGNQQAASRSQHPGGVHVAMLDGAVRFISNEIDPGVWHILHSRETPADVVDGDVAELIYFSGSSDEAPPSKPPQEWSALDGVVQPLSMKADAQAKNSLGMFFVVIPPGEFIMGIPDNGNDHDLPAECPAHLVRISTAFQLGTHEVSRRQFFETTGRLPIETGSSPLDQAITIEDIPEADFPVVNVTWDDAADFCRKLSMLPAERRAGHWYRLPTEAEWEYACRAGESTPYLWTRQRSMDDLTGETAGIVPALPIQAIGSYSPNQFGLFDMRGNAWEWTADWFDRDYYRRSPNQDPRGPAVGYIKVVRGGDWRFVGEACHIDYAVMPPWKANAAVGFRVVRETVTNE